MKHKSVLSSAFNKSWGFIPVIITLLLCEYITQGMSIYIGTATGVGYTFYDITRRGTRMPNFILYISTVVLIMLALAASIPGNYIPPGSLPLTLEVSILIPILILYLHRQRFINYFLKQKEICSKRLFAQGAESAIVSARVVLLLGGIHFIIVSIVLFINDLPTKARLYSIIFQSLPAFVFICSILFNQIGIHYFNLLMKHTEFVPIVNIQGDVIGKSLAIEALNYKNAFINPVIRIAISVDNRIFLCNRSQSNILDRGKTDYPLECYLHYGETLAEGMNRIIKKSFPAIENIEPLYSISYHFENKQTNRLIYLFILDIKDDAILCTPQFKNGKLWGFQQIEQNLGMHFFSECFEKEYEHLKAVIDTREKYKVF